MKYRQTMLLAKEVFELTKITEEHVERDLIMRMVKDIPLNDLKKIFTIEKFDPSVREKVNGIDGAEMTNYNPITWSAHVNDKMMELYQRQEIEYSVEINIP